MESGQHGVAGEVDHLGTDRALVGIDLLDRTDGDLLVFLPGMYEIRQAARQLDDLARERGLAVLPLH